MDISTNLTQQRFPASYSQEQFWFLGRLFPSSGNFNLPFAFMLDGEFCFSQFEQTVYDIVAQESILRTRFEETENGIEQVIIAESPLKISYHDHSDKSLTDEDISTLVNGESQLPFDLLSGPYFKCQVLKVSSSKHVLFFCFHNIIVDYSGALRLFEMMTDCNKATNDESLNYSNITNNQYIEFAKFQKDESARKRMLEKLEDWKQYLSGFSEGLSLASNLNQNSLAERKGAYFDFEVEPSIYKRLSQYAKQQDFSMLTLLMGAFSLVLNRFSGQTDFAIGTPFSNKSGMDDYKNTIGCFENVLPILTEVNADQTIHSLLQKINESLLFANQRSSVPFEHIVEALNPHRELNANPIFQTGVALNQDTSQIRFGDCKTVPLKCHNGGANLDLMVSFLDDGEKLKGAFEFDKNSFDHSSVERMCDYLSYYIAHLIELSEVKCGDIKFISSADNLLLQPLINTDELDLESYCGVHQLVQQVSNEHSASTAIRFQEQSINYAQLQKSIAQMANYLISKGIEPGSLVCVCLERSPDYLISILAILTVGAGYVPVDPRLPRERVSYMLHNSRAKHVMVQNSTADLCNIGDDVHLLNLEQDNAVINESSTQTPAINTTLDSTAYVIYTSGSTGNPKGVEITHRSVINLLKSMTVRPGIESTDRLLAVTTMSFDISVLEVFLPLINGATVVLATRDIGADGAKLTEVLAQERITILQATPATWKMLLASGWSGDPQMKALTGGEQISASLASQLNEKVAALWNMYGPTETTVWSSCEKITGNESISIGTPIHNTQFAILDSERRMVPVGVAGELYIGGSGLSKGYLHQQELTIKNFVQSPIKEISGKLYKTGDIVRLTSDGGLIYCNRRDNQVKVRGYRIELGEIEKIMEAHSDLVSVAVMIDSPRPDDHRIVAYFVAAQDKQVLPTWLRKWLKKLLPEYMVPQHFIELDEMPLTPNGKIDKKGLPSAFGSISQKTVKLSPRDHAERSLAKIWGDVLNIEVDNICVEDNFYEIGGHSLLSIRVIALIKKQTNVQLNPSSLILNNLEQVARECGFSESESDAHYLPEQQATKSNGLVGFFSKLFKS
ncbi:non-ribosomal peptide synthetase [Aliikangiella coralliicola]|uniref:Amino acid adenylation domain-containing protein n=1 Tax=Aliikangiella coralliicola TaxID=2592383 RepID=A0A545UHF5_9GAMM|nr:non-ribosomal peptide synthetase [Aliikangiella coralliicola]TQV88904.1 amino acid adenylation domain-containing protein [Aliikangiella coralliicola]